PQTIGPFNTFFWRKLCFFVLRRLKFLYVRDKSSYDLVSQFTSDIRLEKDMAAFMAPEGAGSVYVNTNGFAVGLNVNGLMFFGSYGKLNSNLALYKEFVITLLKSLEVMGVRAIIIP